MTARRYGPVTRPRAWLGGLTGAFKPALYVAAGVVVLVLGFLAYNWLTAKDDTYQVTAYFEKGIGLYPHSDVDILGVAVGKIRDVRPEGPRVKVTMDIQKDYKVPADARAKIVPISVIADRYIQLYPVYDGGPALQDGAVIGVERTEIPAELDDVFKQLKKLLDAVKPEKPGDPGPLGELVVELRKSLNGREQDLKGTLIQTARLTHTLSQARANISGVLVNLDRLFGRLSTRAATIGTLNRNFAVVMATLAASRNDLRGTVRNLGDMTYEVGSLLRQHRNTLGRTLGRGVRITSSVLRNRASVEESLAWLPVVARGLIGAHNAEFRDTDVRDNAQARIDCDPLREIVDGLPEPLDPALQPIVDFINEICPDDTQQSQQAAARQAEAQGPTLPEINCDEGIAEVKRQLRRIDRLNLPGRTQRRLLRPLNERIDELAQRCEELGEMLERTGVLDILRDLLRELPGLPGLPGGGGGGGIGNLPNLESPNTPNLNDPLPDLNGNAAGTAVVGRPSPGIRATVGKLLDRVLGFIGWSG